MDKKIAGYMKSLSDNSSLHMQKKMLTNYCTSHHLSCDVCYIDTEYRKRKTADIPQALRIGIPATCKLRMLPAWEQLMLDIMDNKIAIILVDTIIRLYRNAETKVALDGLCQKYQVKIIEVGAEPFPGDSATKVAIYHYTDQAQHRPLIVTKTIDSLYFFSAHSYPGSACTIFLDTSLLECEHLSYRKLMENISSFDIILVHDIYRLSKKMTTFFDIVQKLKAAGVCIVSFTEGAVQFSQDIGKLQIQPLRVAIYDRDTSISKTDMHGLFLDRCKLFIKYRTRWSIAGIYLDKRDSPSQPKLQCLIRDRPAYDLVLMDSFRKIHENSSRFYKFKARVEAPLVSLREGSVL